MVTVQAMVTVQTMATNPSSVARRPRTLMSPTNLFPSISSATLFEPFCIRGFRRTRSGEQKPLSTSSLCFQAFKHVAIQGGSSRSSSLSSNVLTEMGLLFSLFQKFGLEEGEIQVLLDKHPALRFTSLESLHTRVHSLQSVGFDGFALCRLITKCPDILTAEEIGPLLCFIHDDLEGKIEPMKLERFLTINEPHFFVGFAEKVRLLLHHGIPREEIPHVLNNVNLTKVFCHKPSTEIERMILFLNRFGGVDLIIRRPSLLNLDLESQLIPRTGFFTELGGGDEDATGVVLRKLPAVLTYTVEHLQSHAEFFRSFVGLTDEEIFKIVLVYPNVISVSKERKLLPRIEFLQQCGLNSSDIFKFLIKAPLFLSLSFKENLSKKLGFLVKIGYENRTKELALAMGAVTRTSCENLQQVIMVFFTYGLSCGDILAMSKRHPQVLQYNHKSLEKKMEYLIEEMGREIGELLAFPAFLGYKLDDRIKHRYEVKKKLIGEGMSLNKLLSVSTERFLKKKKSSVNMKHNLIGGED